jgi:arabinose-5-phosphate isomerase
MVDGGVTEDIRDKLTDLGVSEVVVGSRFRDLAKNAEVKARIAAGKGVLSMAAKTIMRPLWATPSVVMTNSLSDVLEKMNSSHVGYVALTSADNKLVGIISDGDIRRGLAAHLRSGVTLTDIDRFINRNPISLRIDESLGELFHKLAALGFPKINHVMVVDESGALVGHIPDDILGLL